MEYVPDGPMGGLDVSASAAIDRMGNGREMDALVAEKVMGRRWFTFIRNSYLLDPDAASSICFRGSSWTEGKQAQWDSECLILTDLKFQRVPDYSTDIAAAWDVVEKMKNSGSRGFVLEWLRGHWIAGCRNCGDGGEPELYSHQAGEGATAPLAICRAALKAVGVSR